MQIYVNRKYTRSGNGSKEYPFRNISEAAAVACPGDEVLVAPGVYREYVDPKQAGTEEKRIVYRSIEPEKLSSPALKSSKTGKNTKGTSTLPGFRTGSSAVTTPIPLSSAATGISLPTSRIPEKST